MPIWIIMTIIYIIGIIWSLKSNGQIYGLDIIIKFIFCTLGYMIYWIAQLIIWLIVK